MSNEILRVDSDLYCVWNNTCDGPEMWGSREEVREYLFVASKTCTNCGHNEVDDRLQRAEEYGTSALWRKADTPPTGFIYNQEGWLPFYKIASFLASFDEKAQTFNVALLEPFEAA